MHPLDKFKFCPVCGSPKFEINNSISKRCDDCGFVYYFNPRAATVALIRNKKGDILVAKRAKNPAKGTLDLPGGFIDRFETAEEGVKREVLEETGLIVENTKYLFSLPNIYPYSGMDIHTLDLFFECTVNLDSKIEAMDDVAELFWMPVEKINPDEFGLKSVKKGIAMYKEMIINKKTF